MVAIFNLAFEQGDADFLHPLHSSQRKIQYYKNDSGPVITEELITTVGQEMEMLNHKLSSSKDTVLRISTKVELLR